MTLLASALARAALSLLLVAGGAAALAPPPGAGAAVTPAAATGTAPAAPAATAATAASDLFARPWRWTTELGEARTFDAWRGQTLVVAPFYTSCQVRCPQTLRKLTGIAEAYRRAGRAATFVLVTLDPENDTAPRLRRFKERNGLPAAWHLLSGSAADTRGLSELLETRTAYDSSHIDHQVRIAVFDRRGHLARNLHGWDFDVAQALID